MEFDYFYGQQAEQFSFYRIPKMLFTDDRFWNVSTDAKLLYGILLDRMNLSARNGWMDAAGRVYIIFTLEETMAALNCGDKGNHYTDKQEAGEAILAVCKESKATEPVPIGSYRGFQMELSFDSFRHEFDIVLKGSMSHRVSLGTDGRGNLIRLDNALAGIPDKLNGAREQLANLYNQQEATKAEVGKPFPQEAELAAKSQRLAELDAALNMEETVESRAERGSERPSVLADLKAKSEHIPPAHRHNESREEVL